MKSNKDKVTNKDKVKGLLKQLEAGVKDVFSSEKYMKYLKVMSKFHNYSLNNTLLILMQKPDATLVAGYKAWQTKFKRYVNKGEKGIQILAPATYKTVVEMEKIDPETQQPVIGEDGNPVIEKVEVTKPYFKPVYVFDISQTSGEPLPEITTRLTGDVENYGTLFESLKQVSPFPIKFEAIQGKTNGYCDPVNKRIAIKNGMSQAQTIKTCIHEIAHAKLHGIKDDNTIQERKDRHTEEVEAESIAYVVCSYLGLDTSDYSFGYVAGWSKDRELPELKKSLNTIQKASSKLIQDIENKFKELSKEKSHGESGERLSIKARIAMAEEKQKNINMERKQNATRESIQR